MTLKELFPFVWSPETMVIVTSSKKLDLIIVSQPKEYGRTRFPKKFIKENEDRLLVKTVAPSDKKGLTIVLDYESFIKAWNEWNEKRKGSRK